MRIRAAIVAFVLAVPAAACTTSAPSPAPDSVEPVPASPLGAVERAQEVANQVEQRQAQLEAQLNDPFQQP